MQVTITKNNTENIIIALKGELDTATVDQFTQELESVQVEKGQQLVVDFSELEYISSAGMRILLRQNKQTEEKGGHMTITGMSEDIRQIFQMTGFDQMITIE